MGRGREHTLGTWETPRPVTFLTWVCDGSKQCHFREGETELAEPDGLVGSAEGVVPLDEEGECIQGLPLRGDCVV